MAALEPGTLFPTVPLFDESGASVELPAGEAVYAFFKTSCPTSELAWPFLERIRGLAEGGGLRVVAVSQDPPEETAAFNRRLGVRVETLHDPEPWPASDAAGVTAVPTLFLVDRERRIRETVVGFQKRKMEELGALAAEKAGRPGRPVFAFDEDVPEMRPG